jgi:hypothetical protein
MLASGLGPRLRRPSDQMNSKLHPPIPAMTSSIPDHALNLDFSILLIDLYLGYFTYYTQEIIC